MSTKAPSSLADLPPLVDESPAASGPQETRLNALMARLRSHEDRKWLVRVAVASVVVLGIGGAAWAAIEFWPRRQPDYLADPMDEVLDFTLLTTDFNKLPIDKRLSLIKDLISRLKNMTPQDAALMAAFATRLQEEARRQLEENAKRLALDVLDTYADDYRNVPEEERARFMDQKLLEFTRMMEDLAGDRIGLSENDDERLAQLKRQAKRDQERLREGGAPPIRADRVSQLIVDMQRDAHLTSPLQQAQMTRFMRDMVRHVRGESIDGSPPPPPAPVPEPSEKTKGSGGRG
ncbi:MAG: hypothetical protein KF745_09320 [Phycisphaeraceae bacterium]|nr:hypothetical protein [Phycisphaeraceae bacterium]